VLLSQFTPFVADSLGETWFFFVAGAIFGFQEAFANILIFSSMQLKFTVQEFPGPVTLLRVSTGKSSALVPSIGLSHF
jgi:hypothetical protein